MSIIHDIQNATTCNGMREWTDERVGQAMREYAKAVAEDALKRAVTRYKASNRILNEPDSDVTIQCIMETPINTDL